jgi:hypothetical protein
MIIELTLVCGNPPGGFSEDFFYVADIELIYKLHQNNVLERKTYNLLHPHVYNYNFMLNVH